MHYRRAPHLLAYWREEGVLRLLNLSTERTLEAEANTMEVLACCSDWASAEDIAVRLPHCEQVDIERELCNLACATMVLRIDQRRPERDRLLRNWEDWSPAATHFHMATRNVPFADSTNVEPPAFTLQSKPAVLKSYANACPVECPPFSRAGTLAKHLLNRRTWRRFSGQSISLNALSTLCGLTWGVQSWVVFDGISPQALKTSPSGGARHSIEAYVAALKVDGLESGLYHYGPDSHAFTRIRESLNDRDIAAFLPAQKWYTRAAFIVFMTSVFGRVQWRYPHARSYRNVFIEAGHLAQTFCLLATEMGLAPFCTAAISEDAVEPALGIDGVSEAVLYAVGAGARPENTDWAPLPDSDLLPKLVAPSYLSRSESREPGVE